MSIDLDQLARDAVASAPTTTPTLGALRGRVKQRRRNRRILAGALAAPVMVLASLSLWTLLDGDGSRTQVVAANGDERPGPTAERAAAAPGAFVWPAPPRQFGDLDTLTSGLIEEVLGWSPDRVRQDGGNDDNAPQSFTLVNLETNRELPLWAVPSAQGWGFVQIGDPQLVIHEAVGGGGAIEFQVPAGTTSGTVEIRFLDGTITSVTTADSEVPLRPDRPPQSVASVLITFADDTGTVITAMGGQFNVSSEDLPAVTEDATIPVAAAPSQSEADAARDQIVPAVAALPFDVRVHQVDELFGPTRVDTDEGTWIISQPLIDSADLTDGCTLGDPDGVDGLGRVCVHEYAEILLLAHGTGQIIYAYPFAGLMPQTLQATSDAVYCIRQGDGGLPDSMLCRIDLATLDATVRVFPSAFDSGFPPADGWMPSSWTVDEPTELVLWENLDATDTGVMISGWSGTAAVDPDTLAIVSIDETASR